jgi:branched-chain amino acid transport system substrate-binding protein
VTTDALQGPAGADYAHSVLHAKSFFLVDDKLTYGAGLAAAFAARAKSDGMKEVGSGHIDSTSTGAEAQTAQAIAANIVSKKPDMVYCGCDAETSGSLPRDLRSQGYNNTFMGGDALENQAWVTTTAGPVGSKNNVATNVGPDTSKAPSSFKNLYKKILGSWYAKKGIGPYDATAYDAARIVLTAVFEAAKAHQLTGNITHIRTMVVKYVHSINYYGAVGHTTFDNNGDTTNRIVSVYAVQGGKYVFKKELHAVGCPTCAVK